MNLYNILEDYGDICNILKPIVISELPKNRENDPFNRKNGIFKIFQKSSIFYCTRFSQPKYHIPR